METKITKQGMDSLNPEAMLGWRERIGYGIGSIGTSVIFAALTGFLLIYLTNVGVNLGMAGVIPEKYSGANLTENAVKLVPKTDKFRGTFIANYINSPGIQEYIMERKMAVGVPKLAIFRIETMPLIIPPIEKQDEFAEFRAQVDKSKAVIQKSLDETQLLFDSLMQKYFG